MIRGHRAYAEINGRIESLRGQVAAHARRMGVLSARIEQLHAEEARHAAALAKVRLDAVQAREAGEVLGRAERIAAEEMSRWQSALDAVESGLVASQARQDALERQREDLATAVAARQDQRARLAAAVRGRHGDDPQWRALSEREQALASQAALALEKAGIAESDRVDKGRPYERDPLFTYLWLRGYGGPDYRAGGLVRMLDGWIARRVGWTVAARDYRLLIALPLHLAEHARRLEAERAAAHAALLGREAQLLSDAGDAELASAQAEDEARLAGLLPALAAEEASHAGLLARRAELAQGGDEFTRRALETLQAAVAGVPAERLAQAASGTARLDDDHHAAAIAALREQRSGLDRELALARGEHAGALAALDRVEALRRRFRQSGYDHRDSELDDGLDWTGLLDGVLRGALELARAWEQVAGHQRFKVAKGMRVPEGVFDDGRRRD
ncbi:MAG: hypothetical protein KF823_03510 [Xanthomonadales bacterium]|nr:hypothetical protein [Xanthomonadales bacterium]